MPSHSKISNIPKGLKEHANQRQITQGYELHRFRIRQVLLYIETCVIRHTQGEKFCAEYTWCKKHSVRTNRENYQNGENDQRV